LVTANKRARLLSSTMITGVALATASAVYAQTAPAGDTSSVTEVVVTGSRIPTPNLTSSSPVAVVTSQEIRLEGTTNVETLLNNLPQVSADFGLTSDNGTSGEATVDLRGLGSKRTLVLVDGRRLMPGDPLNPVPNLDNIPAALVDRVDVLTGGASATYGSDAISGVVNFIMKKDFVGVRLDAQYGIYDYPNDNTAGIDQTLATGIFNNNVGISHPNSPFWGGRTWDITAILGVNAPDGKGNITAYAEYRHVDPITQGQLDYGRCEVETESFATPLVYDTHYCAGSSNSAYGKFTPASSFAGVHKAQADNPNGTNTFIPFNSSLYYNFAPYQYQLSENERYSAGYFAHYDIDNHFQVYSDFMFARSETQGQLGPSGLFQDIYNVNCNNPLLTAGGIGVGSQAYDLCGVNAGTATIAQAAIGYRFANVSGSAVPRDYDYVHEAYKVDIGMKGDIVKGWSYDVYAQYGESDFNEQIRGQLSKTSIQNALEVNPDGTCFVGGNCVPLNIFNINGVTTAQAAYLSAPGLEIGYTREQVVEANISGDLGVYGIKSPFAKDGIGVAFGADYRGEHLGLTTDALTASGDISGSGGATPPANGGYDVKELYAEIRVPIAQDIPFFQNLEVGGGYRYSEYSQAGETNTYKVTGEWAPISDVKFRGSYNRAVRAPNVVELFTPQTPGLFSGNDPCAANPNSGAANPILPGNALYAGCLASFNSLISSGKLTTAQAEALLAAGTIPACAAAQCNQIGGGNPNLKPEVANTYSGGVVLQPHWVPGLSFTIDYFRIKVTGVIETGLGGAAIELSQCTSTANPLYCNLVQRDPEFGSIAINGGAVLATNVNAGALQTSGFDFDFNYRVHFKDYFNLPDWGSLTFNYVATYTTEFLNTPIVGQGTYNCVGLYGAVCGTPTPYFRSKLRVTWQPADWPITLSGQWRYIGGVGLDANHLNDPFFAGNVPQNDPTVASYDTIDARIPAFSYFDVTMTWKVKDKITFRAGVNNILAKDPPIVGSSYTPLPFGNGNTFPNVYDSLGRQIFVGVTADF
jgi:outer membrane receptor protein involved in Fe transport